MRSPSKIHPSLLPAWYSEFTLPRDAYVSLCISFIALELRLNVFLTQKKLFQYCSNSIQRCLCQYLASWKKSNGQNMNQSESRLESNIFHQIRSYFGCLLRNISVLNTFCTAVWIFSHTFTKNCKSYSGWGKCLDEQLSILLVISMNDSGTHLQVVMFVWCYCLTSCVKVHVCCHSKMREKVT